MDKVLDRIAKAPPLQKFGGLIGLVVAITALSYFLGVQPVEDAITQQAMTQRTLDTQLAEKQEIAQNLNERRDRKSVV